jgi:hypothetical protein
MKKYVIRIICQSEGHVVSSIVVTERLSLAEARSYATRFMGEGWLASTRRATLWHYDNVALSLEAIRP